MSISLPFNPISQNHIILLFKNSINWCCILSRYLGSLLAC